MPKWARASRADVSAGGKAWRTVVYSNDSSSRAASALDVSGEVEIPSEKGYISTAMQERDGSETAGEVTRLLRDLEAGDGKALERLLPLVYAELKGIARRQMSRERADHTLRPTALVHEAYMRLVASTGERFESRAHFFGVAARAMRQVLIDHARKRAADKRGGGRERTSPDEERLGVEYDLDGLIALDDALRKLEEMDERAARVVEQRFFAGLTESEIAALLGITERTVQRDWARARAWLYRELYAEGTE